MKIRIHKIEISNIRNFRNVTFNFVEPTNHDTCAINLCLMPSGTGKTTILELLRSTLSGQGERSPRRFQPRNWPASEGTFSVHLSFPREEPGGTISKRQFLLTQKLFFSTNEARFTHTTDTRGEGLDFHIPAEFRPLLQRREKGFLKLFLFNGELSKTLIGEQRAGSKAIEDAFFLTDFRDFISAANEYKNEKLNAVTKGAQPAAVTRVNNEIAALKETLDHLINKKTTLDARIEEVDNNIGDLTDKRSKAYEAIGIFEEVQKLKNEEGQLSQELIAESYNTLIKIRNPMVASAHLDRIMRKLADSMLRMKLPKAISKEFFKELAEHEKNCICGTPINQDVRQQILQNVDKYLTDQEVGILNRIKSHIREQPEELSIVPAEISKMHAMVEQRESMRQRIKTLVERSGTTSEKIKEVETLSDQLEKLAGAREKLLLSYKNLTDKDNLAYASHQLNIPKCEASLAAAEKKLAEITNNQKVVQKVEFLEGLILESIELANKKLANRIVNETNDKLTQISNIGSERLILNTANEIQYDSQDSLSEGQSLAAAFCFVGSIFQQSSIDVPMVLDSPGGKVDPIVMQQFSKLLPKIFAQMIYFMTVTEAEHMSPILEGTRGAKIHHIAAFLDDIEPIDVMYFEGKSAFDKLRMSRLRINA